MPVPLSDKEWAKINADLPDVEFVCGRIVRWKRADYVSVSDAEITSALRKSNVCFRDAAYTLNSARYALGQAIGVRQYFMSKSQTNHDTDHAMADIRSRFYADYMPLLLIASAEHTFAGLQYLFDLKISDKISSRFKPVLDALSKQHPGHNMVSFLTSYGKSSVREKMRKYRNDWVHNKPPIVESILYNSPRHDFRHDEGDWKMFAVGVHIKPDYTWDGLIALLKVTTQETAVLLEKCADEWEKKYQAFGIVNDNS